MFFVGLPRFSTTDYFFVIQSVFISRLSTLHASVSVCSVCVLISLSVCLSDCPSERHLSPVQTAAGQTVSVDVCEPVVLSVCLSVC